MKKQIRVPNPLPSKNAIGQKYPRWHSKHPSNAIAVPATVAPTVARNK